MLNRPDLIAAYLTPFSRGLKIDKFWVLCLNRKNRLKKLVELTTGTATSSLAHIKRSCEYYHTHHAACLCRDKKNGLAVRSNPRLIRSET